MSEWIYPMLIVLLSAVVHAATGFGFAILSTPLLHLVFALRDCILISLVLSLFISVVMLPRIWRRVEYGLLLRLLVGGVAGIPVGLAAFLLVDESTLKTIVSIAILVAVLGSFKKQAAVEAPATQAVTEGAGQFLRRASLQGAKQAMMDPEGRHEIIVGFCAGALASSISMPGVVLMLYFTATNTRKDVVRSTTLTFFVVTCIVSILAILIVDQGRRAVMMTALALLPATAVGVFLGHYIFGKINQKVFRQILYVILVFTAIYLLAFDR